MTVIRRISFPDAEVKEFLEFCVNLGNQINNLDYSVVDIASYQKFIQGKPDQQQELAFFLMYRKLKTGTLYDTER